MVISTLFADLGTADNGRNEPNLSPERGSDGANCMVSQALRILFKRTRILASPTVRAIRACVRATCVRARDCNYVQLIC